MATNNLHSKTLYELHKKHLALKEKGLKLDPSKFTLDEVAAIKSVSIPIRIRLNKVDLKTVEQKGGKHVSE